MSASREKQTRRNLASTGAASAKTAREAKQRQEERRSNLLYGLIAVVLVLIVVGSAIWNSNIIPRVTTAVSADGKNYNAAQAQFWYTITVNSTINRWGYMAGYMGLDTSTSLDMQTIDEFAAEMLDAEPGITWKDYFVQRGIEQMVSASTAQKRAAEEDYVYSDSVKTDLDDAMTNLSTRAAANNMSLGQYIKNVAGAAVTTGIYRTELERYLQYQDYVQSYYDGMAYTTEELETYYENHAEDFDLVDYEAAYIRGTAVGSTDADGNSVEPTEEEHAAAHNAADALSKEFLAAFQAGTSFEELAAGADTASYFTGSDESYDEKDELGSDLADWLFDADRKAGDADIIPSGENYYVAVFNGRHRDENKTVDVRHILIQPETGELSEGDEGYEEEQEALKEAARTKAEELYQQWQDGEATEESFADLAKENTADSNGEDGGLYENVYVGQMVTTFNDWCFDPARKHGDSGIVETEYGYHIMYYVGDNVPRWQAQVKDAAQEADFEAWVKSLYDSADITRHGFGMSFVH